MSSTDLSEAPTKLPAAVGWALAGRAKNRARLADSNQRVAAGIGPSIVRLLQDMGVRDPGKAISSTKVHQLLSLALSFDGIPAVARELTVGDVAAALDLLLADGKVGLDEHWRDDDPTSGKRWWVKP